jgi:hypothetical protein
VQVTNPAARDPARALVLAMWCVGLLFGFALIAGNVAVLHWLGFNVLLVRQLGLADLLVVGGVVAILVKLNRMVDTVRRRHGYVICEEDYADAPSVIKGTMRQIFKSAGVLRTSRAHLEGMFGDLDIERFLFSAAEQAVQAAEINASLRALKANAGPADEDALRRARVALRKIGRQLSEVEAELTEAAKTANGLSKRLAEAQRVRAVAQEAELAAERRREARARARDNIETSTTRAKFTMRIDATDIADRVAAVSAGYEEARKVSDDVLHGPNHDATEPAPSLMQTVWQAIRSAARWVIRI